MPNHFETAQISCLWREQESYWYEVTGFEDKVNHGTIPKNRCRHDAIYRLCSITLKVHTHQWECQEQFAREPLFGRTYFRHSSPLLRGILFLSWIFFHFRFLLTEKWRFLSLKNYIGNILQQNRQKRSASWSFYQIIDDIKYTILYVFFYRECEVDSVAILPSTSGFL